MTWLKFISISVFVLLICLGFWQLSRMEEKNIALTRIEQDSTHQLEGLFTEYSKYELDGVFLYDKNMFLYASNTKHPETNGYFVMTPFCTKAMRCIVTNRGWIPESQRLAIALSQTQKTTHINAMAIKARKASVFLPDNNLEKNMWFYVDLRQMTTFTEVKLENDFYMILLGGDNLSQDLLLTSPKNFFAIRNDHLSYAITWFSLAVAMLALMVAKFREGSNTD